MTRRLTRGILLVGLLAATLAAQQTPPAQPTVVRLRQGIQWYENLEAAKIAARLTDAPIIVYFYYSNHAACMNFEDAVFSQESFRKISGLFVMVRIDARRDPKTAETFHVQRIPMLVYLDSAGEMVKTLDSQMITPRVLNYMARTFLTSMFNSGKRAADAGEVRTAVRRFKTLLIVGAGTPPANWADRELQRIAADGVKKLSQAKIALDARDYLAAMTHLDELTYHYRGLPAGADAWKLMNSLNDDPKAFEALKEVERRRQAQRRLAHARKLEESGDLEGALIAYWDVARDDPQTPAADDASRRAEEIVQKDRPLALRAARTRMKRDCSLWLEMAEAYEANNNRTGAIRYYTRVIDNYPETSYADKARTAVNRLMLVKPQEK